MVSGSDVILWLADATGEDSTHVAAELELGERRRVFVVDELADAGYAGAELLGYVMRLTGLDEREARGLIEERDREVRASSDVPKRDASLAQNEISFRAANERRTHAHDRLTPPKQVEVVCECSDRACARTLTMPFAEYEWLRQNPWRFVVLPGHEAPAVESVAEWCDGYVIVEKHAESRLQVETADPRLRSS
jgi:hypothetical protein